MKQNCNNCDCVLTNDTRYPKRNVCRSCYLEYMRNLANSNYRKDPEKAKTSVKMYRERMKKETFSYYSCGEIVCCKCGYSDIRALSLDHINGGGTKHRRELGKVGTEFYRWIKESGYPAGYQVMCMNCQFIKKVDESEQSIDVDVVDDNCNLIFPSSDI